MSEMIRERCVRPGLLQQREGGWTVCLTCERRCRLVEGGTGWCRTRCNLAGTVQTLTDGWVSSLSANPHREEAALPHLIYPGTIALTAEALRLCVGAGLRFVYIGNVPGHPSCNTACPECGMLLLQRQGFGVTRDRLRSGRCPDCGRGIAGVWKTPPGMCVPKVARDGGVGGSCAREH